MRRTFVLPVLNALLRNPTQSAGERFSDRIEGLLDGLRETEADFVADVLRAAEIETRNGFRNLATWWLKPTVERMAPESWGWSVRRRTR